MDRDSNFYTFLFATVMVLAVASVLAFTSQSLKDLQRENVRKEKIEGGGGEGGGGERRRRMRRSRTCDVRVCARGGVG